jgi:hypothetical protein
VFNSYIVTFNATSAQSIALLPDYLQFEFPALLSHKSGLDFNLISDFKELSYKSGLDFNLISDFKDSNNSIVLWNIDDMDFYTDRDQSREIETDRRNMDVEQELWPDISSVEHLNARVEEVPVRNIPEIQEVNEIDLGYNLEIETVQEAMDDHYLGDNNNQEGDMNLNQKIEIDQILYSLIQPTEPTLRTQPPKRRMTRRCTTCGLDYHPQCTKRGSGVYATHRRTSMCLIKEVEGIVQNLVVKV